MHSTNGSLKYFGFSDGGTVSSSVYGTELTIFNNLSFKSSGGTTADDKYGDLHSSMEAISIEPDGGSISLGMATYASSSVLYIRYFFNPVGCWK